MKSFIWVTLQKENFHKWNNAPKNVKYLSYKHRHIFYFKIFIEVKYNDREIEFITFKNYIDSLLDQRFLWKNKSCEMISDWLYEIIKKQYPNREIRIEVSEDNENGSYKEYIGH